MAKIKELYTKYKELILYIIFGGLTTLVNFIAFYLFGLALGDELYLVTNVIAWIISVAFAYVTNKLFVFEAKNLTLAILVKEIAEFVGARVFSFFIEELGLWLLIDICLMKNITPFTILGVTVGGQFIAKVILAVIVVIMNYFFSKFIIFAKKKDSPEETGEEK